MKQTTEEKKALSAARSARWRVSPKGKAKLAEYNAQCRASPKGKAKRAAYERTPKRKARVAAYRSTLEGRAYTLFTGAAKRAKKRGGVCTLTREHHMAGIEAGCPLSGIPSVLITHYSKAKVHPFAPSTDRIDNSNRDYTLGNSRWPCNYLNTAIGEHGLDFFLAMAAKVFEHLKIDPKDPKHKALITAMAESR